jgi:integrase
MSKTPSPVFQANELLKTIDCRGSSKFEAKKEYYAKCRQAGIKATAEGLGRVLGIYSHAVADSYRDTWIELLKHARSDYGIKYLENISSDALESYLGQKLKENISKGTMENICAAIAKLGTAIDISRASENSNSESTNKYNEFKLVTRDFLNNTEIRVTKHIDRAYPDPVKLINNIPREDFRLVAELMFSIGIRCSEASFIRPQQIQGEKLRVIGKGGQHLERVLPNVLAAKLNDYLARHGVLKVSTGSERRAIQKAAIKSGQKPMGTHALRYNFAQALYTRLTSGGIAESVAKDIVSNELGHKRSDITSHYLAP